MAESRTMRLRIVVPPRSLLDERIHKLTAPGRDGAFGMLPRHVDFATVLAPGVLAYVTADGREGFAGLDDAILVKRGDQIVVAAMDGGVGADLATLRGAVARQFMTRGSRESAARRALARLEASMIRRIIELERR